MVRKLSTILLITALPIFFVKTALFLENWIFILFFIALLFIIVFSIWEFIPANTKLLFGNKRKKFVTIIAPPLLFLSFGGMAINHFCFPQLRHPISICGNIGILSFTIFLGWGLLRLKKKKIIGIGCILFILFIAGLKIITLNTYQFISPHSKETMQSLPYVAWTPALDTIRKKGITKHKETLSYKGLNIYNPCAPHAFLINMAGETIHKWEYGTQWWWHVELCNNGDLLVVTLYNPSLIRLSWDSKVKWIKKGIGHHDIFVAKNNDIYTFANKIEIVPDFRLPLPILNEYIVVVSRDGKIKNKFSLFKLFRNALSPHQLDAIHRWQQKYYGSWEEILKLFMVKLIGAKPYYVYDLFHANTLEMITRDIKGICKKDNLLIALRTLDIIAIIDTEQEKLLWKWGEGILQWPHHPTLLENGNILVFDNGNRRQYSRVIELNPLTKNIIWNYTADPPKQFYSETRGANQRLPNGNTLITESDKGRVFEITPDGKIVWEFYNPHIRKEQKERGVIYRMMRIINPQGYLFLKWKTGHDGNNLSSEIRKPPFARK